MRIALITLARESEGDPARVGGQTIAWHQLQAALAAGCEKIACVAHAPGAALAALQREAERRGASFHASMHPRALSGLVSAADTLLVFAPDVLPDRDWLVQALGSRAGVAVLPGDSGFARGFERIDRDRAWAGVLATRGDAIEALGELPPDTEPSAALLRIALQRGARTLEVPEAWLDDGRWAMIPGVGAANRFEPLWYAQRVPEPGLARPSEALAHRLGRMIAHRSALHPKAQTALGVVGGLIALSGGILGYAGFTLAGMATLVIGILVGEVGAALDRFARVGSGSEARRWTSELRDALHDLALVAIAASPSEFAGWPTPFAALVLAAAIRLARQADAGRLERPMGDRALVFALLAIAAAAGRFAPTMAFLGLIALGLRLFSPKPRG